MIYVFFLSLLNVSCVSHIASYEENKLDKLSSRILEKEKRINQLEEENSLLKVLLNKDKINPEVYEKSESYLYEQLVANYKSKNLKAFLKFQEIFKSLYPASTKMTDIDYMTGLIYYKTKNYELALEAFSYFRQTYTPSPQSLTLLFFEALVYKKQGQTQKALKIFESIATKYPGTQHARQAKKQLKADFNYL